MVEKPLKQSSFQRWYNSPKGKAYWKRTRDKRYAQYKKWLLTEKGELHKKRKQSKYPEKHSARHKLRYAVKRGYLKKGNCRDCDSREAQGHHTDYSKPLDVIWLCDSCHKQEHKNTDLALIKT